MTRQRPILTAAICSEIEKLSCALEIFYGKRIELVQIDLRTNRSRFSIGEEKMDFIHELVQSDVVTFTPRGRKGEWITATFRGEEAIVYLRDPQTPIYKKIRCRPFEMQWTGTTVSDRRLVPVNEHEARLCALKMELPYEKFLEQLQ